MAGRSVEIDLPCCVRSLIFVAPALFGCGHTSSQSHTYTSPCMLSDFHSYWLAGEKSPSTCTTFYHDRKLHFLQSLCTFSVGWLDTTENCQLQGSPEGGSAPTRSRGWPQPAGQGEDSNCTWGSLLCHTLPFCVLRLFLMAWRPLNWWWNPIP